METGPLVFHKQILDAWVEEEKLQKQTGDGSLPQCSYIPVNTSETGFLILFLYTEYHQLQGLGLLTCSYQTR
jgi:hypothetical protein